MNPFYQNKKKCPNSECMYEVDEWLFIGECLDEAVIKNESGGISFEIKTECPVCGTAIYGELWLIDVYSESKFKKMDKGL